MKRQLIGKQIGTCIGHLTRLADMFSKQYKYEKSGRVVLKYNSFTRLEVSDWSIAKRLVRWIHYISTSNVNTMSDKRLINWNNCTRPSATSYKTIQLFVYRWYCPTCEKTSLLNRLLYNLSKCGNIIAILNKSPLF